MGTGDLVINFFQVYLAAPIIVVSGVGYKWWWRTRWVRVGEIDLKTGRMIGEDELEGLKNADRVEWEGLKWWKRGWLYFC